jgi:hypothetical protein
VGEASLAVVGCAGLWWVVMFGGRGVLTGRVFVEAWVTGDRQVCRDFWERAVVDWCGLYLRVAWIDWSEGAEAYLERCGEA